jgi:Na+-driven multidrug efflux pump
MRRIVRVAVSSLFESIGMWGGNFTVLVWVGQLGEQNNAVWGSHMIAIRVEAISYLPCFALAIAASTLTGQYLGLGDPQRAKHAGRLCWGWGALIMGLAGASFLLFPYAWCSIVTNQQPLLDTAPHLLWVCGWVQIFLATAIVLSGAMRGAGDTRTTMILTYISIYGIRLPMAYLFGIVLGYGINGIWYGLCIELFIRGFIFGGRYLHGGWAKVKV